MELACWGSSDRGVLGNGGTDGGVVTPTEILESVNVEDFDVGSEHACAVTDAGLLYCWGSQGFGALGDGVNAVKLAPVVTDVL